MSYSSAPVPRRSRRRFAAALLLIVVATVGTIALVTRYRTERRDSTNYLAIAKEIADGQIVIASSLKDLLVNLEDLDRFDVVNRLQGFEIEFQELKQPLSGATVTPAVGEANGFFVVAVTAWEEALAVLDDAVLEIIDGDKESRQGDALLEKSFSNLRVGDRAYASFLEVVETLDDDLRVPDYPDLAYVGSEHDSLWRTELVADLLRSMLRFEENRDVSIVVTTEPEPLSPNGGVPVVPDSDSFVVQAIVTNEGNVIAEFITVTMLLSKVGGVEVEERRQVVAALKPGEATVASFVDIVLQPGTGYELRVVAGLQDDAVSENNVWEMDFIRNQP